MSPCTQGEVLAVSWCWRQRTSKLGHYFKVKFFSSLVLPLDVYLMCLLLTLAALFELAAPDFTAVSLSAHLSAWHPL